MNVKTAPSESVPFASERVAESPNGRFDGYVVAERMAPTLTIEREVPSDALEDRLELAPMLPPADEDSEMVRYDPVANGIYYRQRP